MTVITPANRLKIGILGSLCDNDLVWAEHFLRFGHDAFVLRFGPFKAADLGRRAFRLLSPERVMAVPGGMRALWKLRQFDAIVVNSGVLGSAVGPLFFLYPLFRKLGWPPYINISTGSDVAEQAIENGYGGLLQRATLRNASMNMLSSLPHVLKNAIALKLTNACVLPLPWTPFEPPAPGEEELPEVFRRRSEGELLLFHASRLDWGENDNKPSRVSTKGNDRFFKALALVARDAARPLRCIVLKRGSDVEPAERLIKSLDLEEIVVWHRELTPKEYQIAVQACDLFVDQFDVGGLGGSAVEALLLGVPVLTYLDEDATRHRYPEMPPVLNARSVADIERQIRRALEPGVVGDLKQKAKAWGTVYGWASVVPRYLLHLELATGKRILSYGLDDGAGR